MKNKLRIAGFMMMAFSLGANAQSVFGYGYGTSYLQAFLETYFFLILGVLLFISLFFGIIGSVLGRHKNRIGFPYGFFLWEVGIILLAGLPKHGKKCPYCGGILEEGYKVCANCGKVINDAIATGSISTESSHVHKSIPQDHFMSILENCEDESVCSVLRASYRLQNGFYCLNSGVSPENIKLLEKYFSEIQY